jgi:hypothetical protein
MASRVPAPPCRPLRQRRTRPVTRSLLSLNGSEVVRRTTLTHGAVLSLLRPGLAGPPTDRFGPAQLHADLTILAKVSYALARARIEALAA